MKVVLGCAKDIGGELAALWRGRVELGWEKLKAKTGERSLPLPRRMEDSCGHDRAQDAG